MLADSVKAFDRNKLKPIIGKTFEFDEVKAALEFRDHGAHFGKTVVKVG